MINLNTNPSMNNRFQKFSNSFVVLVQLYNDAYVKYFMYPILHLVCLLVVKISLKVQQL